MEREGKQEVIVRERQREHHDRGRGERESGKREEEGERIVRE